MPIFTRPTACALSPTCSNTIVFTIGSIDSRFASIVILPSAKPSCIALLKSAQSSTSTS